MNYSSKIFDTNSQNPFLLHKNLLIHIFTQLIYRKRKWSAIMLTSLNILTKQNALTYRISKADNKYLKRTI